MSGGSSKSGSAQKWAKPFAIAGANEAQSVYGANKEGLGQITGQVQSLMPDLMTKYQEGNPMLNAAQGYGQSVLGGQYLNGNPHLQGMIDSTAEDVTGRVNSNFGSRGTFGAASHGAALAKNLAEAENAMRFGNYSQERAMQQGAMQSAPQMAAADYLGITPLLSTAQLGAELPYTGLNNYSSALGQLMNGSSQKQGSLGSIMQGVGAAGSAIAMSDRRLKENIEKVGELADGLGVYRWNYIWGPERFEGVMADEVAELRPWALGPIIGGYASVDYGVI